MKSILVSLLLVASGSAFASNVELGKYKAVDADTGTIQASFELKAGGDVDFKVSTSELPQPIACKGKYSVAGNKFSADMKCQSDLLSEVKVNIDVTTVNAESLRSAKGAEVNVVIDALGDEATKFLLKKAD
ncbi:hypothetical protein [Pseudobdellovibrio exovorus]|uniref:Lipocalin-like domain-containing protein n=1 Tax=Pseudobdellovibrio exovorus JSS TaxID=1184267 RepID=M4VE30_9BACT|nr:hypothetical protein [Pseudobdellovibrio exovorus]AGH96301.1 hypothetical protein A11Q_2085 [Pseudobdellovibrio exovorus JSS]